MKVQSFDLQPIQSIIPDFGHLKLRRPLFQPFPIKKLSKTELDFIGILAAIAVKLFISTALATWFLVAGQSLYSIAAMTGTTAVFGQDSTIGYIYKTLPLVEALLRGETMFSHHAERRIIYNS
ncbi:hypothetical protein SK128_026876 [Halocaridina rubra]|uniref:Uncharacterized protein n=1 Tax=Halocaridina rubra TaxID=373956 RepID=A0AAN8XLN1_HALRR